MSIRDQYDQSFAPGWKPEVGDEILGIVTEISEREGRFGAYPILTLTVVDDANGTETLTDERLAVHCAPTALQRWVEEKDPQIGDEVALRRNGLKTGKNGSEYEDYSKGLVRAAEVPTHLKPKAAAPAPVARRYEDEEPF
jgi:hypothetical protein